MVKKVTLSGLTQKVKKLEVARNVLSANGVMAAPIQGLNLPIVSYCFFEDGKNKNAFFCHECGHFWTVDDIRQSMYYYRCEVNCPKCHTIHKMIHVGGAISSDQTQAIIREVNKEERYAIIDIVIAYYTHDSNGYSKDDIFNDGKYEFMKGKFSEELRVIDELIFSLDFGLRTFSFLSGGGDILMNNITTSSQQSSVNRLFTSDFYEDDNYKAFVEMLEEFESGIVSNSTLQFSRILEVLSAKIIQSRRRTDSSGRSTRKTPYDRYLDMNLPEIKVEEIIPKLKIDSTYAMHYETSNRIKKVALYCHRCRHLWYKEYPESAYLYKNTEKCPVCGKVHEYGYVQSSPSCTSTSELSLYDVLEDTKELIIRYFLYTFSVDFKGNVTDRITEYKRIFLSKEKTVVIENEDSKWKIIKKNATITDSPSKRQSGRYYYGATVVNTNEELADIISRSDFKYSGLLEAWGLVKAPEHIKPLEKPGTTDTHCYLTAVIRHPGIEQIYKTGLIRVAKDIMYGNRDAEYIREKASVLEMLGISKQVFNIARAIDPTFRELRLLQSFWEADNSFDLEMYQKIKESGVEHCMQILIEIKHAYNIKYADQLNYLKNCYDYQCILPAQTITIWRDYLKMAKDMNYRLSQSTYKYPSSLKKEHDKAVFAYKVVQDEKNKHTFMEQAEKNKFYEYEGKEFIVKVPRVPEDVVQEGSSLKHCVASYVERIRTGSTTVCFIRKKEDPDTSYFTVEICDGAIIQVKGYTNILPTEDNLIDFINEWADYKEISPYRTY